MTFENHARFVFPLLESGLDVLDAACGSGAITRDLAEAVLPGRVTACDRNAEKIARATRLAEGRELTNLWFVRADTNGLPFPDTSFDLLLAIGEGDVGSRLSEFRRVLRPGGIVALSELDWTASGFEKLPARAADAFACIRWLLRETGFDTASCATRIRTLAQSGFGVLQEGTFTEPVDAPGPALEPWIENLRDAGFDREARALATWAASTGAELGLCWRQTIGIRWNT